MADDRRDVSDYIEDTYAVHSDFKNDEIINVKLPRAKYEILRKIIAREEAMGWLESKWRTHWVWVIGGGLVTIFVLWDRIQALVAKV